MAGLRIRWRFTILWTIVCLMAIGALVERASKPVGAGCIDNCEFDQTISRFFIPWIVVLWLVVTFVVAWLWTRATRIHCPRCRRLVDPPVRFCPNCSYDLQRHVEPDGDGDEPPSADP